jgi:hypothetical protein
MHNLKIDNDSFEEIVIYLRIFDLKGSFEFKLGYYSKFTVSSEQSLAFFVSRTEIFKHRMECKLVVIYKTYRFHTHCASLVV